MRVPKHLAVAVILVLGAAGMILAQEQHKLYTDEYDSMDIDAILNDDEERDRYYACLMDTGPCHTAAALFLRETAAEALATSCRYCTSKQYELFEKLITWFINNKLREWNALLDKTIADAKKQGFIKS